jgi:hypothetical protein
MYSRDVSMRNRLVNRCNYAIPRTTKCVDGQPATYSPIFLGQINSARWEKWPNYNDFDNNGVKGDDPFELQQYLVERYSRLLRSYKPPVEMCHNSKTFFKADEARRLSEIGHRS